MRCTQPKPEQGETDEWVSVDQAACCGSGLCALGAGRVFDQREEDGTAVVLLDAAPAAEHHDAVRAAAAACPTGANRLAE